MQFRPRHNNHTMKSEKKCSLSSLTSNHAHNQSQRIMLQQRSQRLFLQTSSLVGRARFQSKLLQHHKYASFAFHERYSVQQRYFSSQLQDEHDKDEKKTLAKIVKELLSHIWPSSDHPDSTAIKLRVCASVACLFGAKAVTISVPFFFKEIIDSYGDISTISTATDVASMGMYIPALVVGYGVARSAGAGLQELRNTIFATVTQLAIRSVARDVFRHLHELDMKFHTNRNTGTLFRVIDRGSRSINFALTSILFNIVPTTFEVGLVSSILAVSSALINFDIFYLVSHLSVELLTHHLFIIIVCCGLCASPLHSV
jgi:hypothetical protein